MANKKIAFIGAGSMCFAPRLLKDFANAPAMHGSTIALMDIDRGKKDLITHWAKKFYGHHGIDFKIIGTANLETAVKDADFVIISVSAARMETWKKDLRLPKKFGVLQYLSENGGPGGLSHGLRSCTIVMNICRAIEKHAPDALVLNLTNPMMRVCTAIREYTGLKFAGLCHQAYNKTRNLAEEVLNLPFEAVHPTVAGINHFTWALQLRRAGTGEDLYPRLDKGLRKKPAAWEPLTRELYTSFGIWPLSGDNHVHEYLPYVHVPQHRPLGKYGLQNFDFAGYARRERQIWNHHQRQAEGKAPIEPLSGRHSGEYADRIISAVIEDSHAQLLSLNIPNRGCINNLPDDAIVEVRCMVNANGVHGIHAGALPRAVASLCKRQIDINELTAQAAVEGNRQKALEALLIDPYINDIAAANRVLDTYLRVHARYLPQFHGRTGGRRQSRGGKKPASRK